MSSLSEGHESDVSGGTLTNALDTFRQSLSLKIAIIGAVFLGIGFVLDVMIAMPPAAEARSASADLWGIWAGILAVWGGALLILGSLAFVVIWWKRQ